MASPSPSSTPGAEPQLISRSATSSSRTVGSLKSVEEGLVVGREGGRADAALFHRSCAPCGSGRHTRVAWMRAHKEGLLDG